jgi:hypothetical protein
VFAESLSGNRGSRPAETDNDDFLVVGDFRGRSVEPDGVLPLELIVDRKVMVALDGGLFEAVRRPNVEDEQLVGVRFDFLWSDLGISQYNQY